jgi:hypothetical protein
VKLEIPCDDRTSRALLEEFKACCQKGWYFETLRWTDDGDMIYKFFLLDLSEQTELEDKKFVRYYGWLEAGECDRAASGQVSNESERIIWVKAAGQLESMFPLDLRVNLLTRFHDDVVVPVCKRHNVIARLLSAT